MGYFYTKYFSGFGKHRTSKKSEFQCFFQSFFLIDPRVELYFVGVLFSKYNLFSKVDNYIQNKNKFILGIFGLCVLAVSEMFVAEKEMNMIYMPIYIICMSYIINVNQYIKKLFMFLGKHSTNMWLVHSFSVIIIHQLQKSCMQLPPYGLIG